MKCYKLILFIILETDNYAQGFYLHELIKRMAQVGIRLKAYRMHLIPLNIDSPSTSPLKVEADDVNFKLSSLECLGWLSTLASFCCTPIQLNSGLDKRAIEALIPLIFRCLEDILPILKQPYVLENAEYKKNVEEWLIPLLFSINVVLMKEEHHSRLKKIMGELILLGFLSHNDELCKALFAYYEINLYPKDNEECRKSIDTCINACRFTHSATIQLLLCDLFCTYASSLSLDKEYVWETYAQLIKFNKEKNRTYFLLKIIGHQLFQQILGHYQSKLFDRDTALAHFNQLSQVYVELMGEYAKRITDEKMRKHFTDYMNTWVMSWNDMKKNKLEVSEAAFAQTFKKLLSCMKENTLINTPLLAYNTDLIQRCYETFFIHVLTFIKNIPIQLELIKQIKSDMVSAGLPGEYQAILNNYKLSNTLAPHFSALHSVG